MRRKILNCILDFTEIQCTDKGEEEGGWGGTAPGVSGHPAKMSRTGLNLLHKVKGDKGYSVHSEKKIRRYQLFTQA